MIPAAASSAALLLIPNDRTGPVSVPKAAILIGRSCGSSGTAAPAVKLGPIANAPASTAFKPIARDFFIVGLHELRLMSASTMLRPRDASADLEALRGRRRARSSILGDEGLAFRTKLRCGRE